MLACPPLAAQIDWQGVFATIKKVWASTWNAVSVRGAWGAGCTSSGFEPYRPASTPSRPLRLMERARDRKRRRKKGARWWRRRAAGDESGVERQGDCTEGRRATEPGAPPWAAGGPLDAAGRCHRRRRRWPQWAARATPDSRPASQSYTLLTSPSVLPLPLCPPPGPPLAPLSLFLPPPLLLSPSLFLSSSLPLSLSLSSPALCYYCCKCAFPASIHRLPQGLHRPAQHPNVHTLAADRRGALLEASPCASSADHPFSPLL